MTSANNSEPRAPQVCFPPAPPAKPFNHIVELPRVAFDRVGAANRPFYAHAGMNKTTTHGRPDMSPFAVIFRLLVFLMCQHFSFQIRTDRRLTIVEPKVAEESLMNVEVYMES